MPTLLFSGCERDGHDRLTPNGLHRGQIPGMRNHRWRLLLGANNHSHSTGGEVEEPPRKFTRQVDAAMRLGISGKTPGMQRDATPSQTLHIGHGSTVVNGRPMLLLLLQDGEDPDGSRVPRAAGADSSSSDQDAVTIKVRPLFGDADDQDQRPRSYGPAHPQKLPFLQLVGGRVDRH